jgi:hypothetical protein
LRVIFKGRHKSGRLDLEAIEVAVRPAMHHAGATALTKLLQFPTPVAGQRRRFRRSCLVLAVADVNNGLDMARLQHVDRV